MALLQIFCPLCGWRPEQTSRWVCTRKLGGCGNAWNTFDTRGVCPKCSWHWVITQCLACQQFSPHEAWYHDPSEDPARAEEHDEELADV
jgi:hypothetical protein